QRVDPPIDPPHPVDPETGTLEVEVVVEGEPDFDMGRVTVSAQGPAGSASASRVLTEREGNLWTEPGLDEGSWTVRGTVDAPAMSGVATAAVRPGQTTRVRLTLVRATGVARAFPLSFRFNSAFVEPCMRAVLRRAAAYSDAHPSERLVVVGHTDKVDDPPYNQSLSERRARTVFASLDFLSDGPRAAAEWSAVRRRRVVRNPTEKDTWGVREYQQMLQQLGYYPARIDGIHGPITDEAVRAFRCDQQLPPGTAVDDDVWDALVPAYLADDPPSVPRGRFLPNCPGRVLEWLGCGEESPLHPEGEVERAFRPNRRVELLFVTDAALPCPVRVPDTWALPDPAGHSAADWCVGTPTSSRTCFISRGGPSSPPVPPAWTVQPADAAQVPVRGRIRREVEQPDGSVSLVPAAGTRFVLITAHGDFKGGETARGEGVPATTDGGGEFALDGVHPAGVFVLEVQEKVLARPAADPAAHATGPTVCGTLLADGDRLDVVILRDPVLREVRLPVIAHLMTALHPGTREVRTCPDPANPAAPRPQRTAADEAAVRALLAAVNEIWRRARVRLELGQVVRETFDTPVVTECHVGPDEADQVVAGATTPNFVNLFLFGSLETTGDAGRTVASVVVEGADETLFDVDAVTVGDRAAVHPAAGAPAVERAPGADEQAVIVAHHLGHY
ncbi:MAG TPA: peptidoglycan-binding protein, partial [Longimicrobium sp.]|nr:peptidoglycan-binding protein [Longimicrobium sp.]